MGFGKSAIGKLLRYALEKCCRGLVGGNSTLDGRPQVGQKSIALEGLTAKVF